MQEYHKISKQYAKYAQRPFVLDSSVIVSLDYNTPYFAWKAFGKQKLRRELPGITQVIFGGSMKARTETTTMKVRKDSQYTSAFQIHHTPTDYKQFRGQVDVSADSSKNEVIALGTLKYSHENARVNVEVESTKAAMAAVTFGYPHIGAGVKARYEFGAKRLSEYNAAAWAMYKGVFTLLRHTSNNKLSYVPGTFHLQIRSKVTDKSTFGVILKRDCIKKENATMLFAQHKPSDNVKLNSTFENESGMLALANRYTVNSNFRILSTLRLIPSAMSREKIDYSFGINFEFMNGEGKVAS